MKIHIIGCSGSGKSYLAEYLSRKYNIPHFDLDDLQWDNQSDSYGMKRPEKVRAEMLQELLAKDNWIIEGVYYSWVEQSFEKADVIYVLDLPKSVVNLLKWTDTFQKKNMKEIRLCLQIKIP